jgi:hypothetical protein
MREVDSGVKEGRTRTGGLGRRIRNDNLLQVLRGGGGGGYTCRLLRKRGCTSRTRRGHVDDCSMIGRWRGVLHRGGGRQKAAGDSVGCQRSCLLIDALASISNHRPFRNNAQPPHQPYKAAPQPAPSLADANNHPSLLTHPIGHGNTNAYRSRCRDATMRGCDDD